ncbi:MAG: CRISPR-associated helicase Cas3' [Candidatus Xenobiia bacterium LiM19]
MNNNKTGTKYYAHSKKGELPDKWQPLDEHLKNVAELAAGYAAKFFSQDWAYNAGMLHDLGKADSIFQGYLLRENELDDSDYDSGRVNHSSAGAALAEEKFGPFIGRTYAYIVAGHHAGLPDWYPSKTGNAALSIRLDIEGKNNLSRIREYADSNLPNLKSVSKPPSFVKPSAFHFWVRMIYSCMVDADFLDTEQFMNPEQTVTRSHFDTLVELKRKFDGYMSTLVSTAKKTPVNDIRKEVLDACRKAADEVPGFFRLSVPTGGGKTLSSIAFALDHSLKQGKERIIYVIPYTSIIEQTAKILSDIFGAENVVEHHSNLDPDKETPRLRLASENWDAPIIVTTNVQFFESLYAAKSSRCRKLHNIINSVIILDEAQLLPPNLLTPCVDAMNQLVKHYNVTLVLATATQPALPDIEDFIEIVHLGSKIYHRLKRTRINIPKALNSRNEWNSIADQLKKHEQVLCIVNTRKDCYELHKLMPDGTIHLSALMCGFHRSRIIRYIKWRLKKSKPIRVISTQLVEAGVDIDFPVVYRAFAGLDSIAQAAGRCNREGKLNNKGQMGQVHVFIPPKPAPPGLLRKGEDTTKELCNASSIDMDSPETYNRYFELFYSRINETGTQFSDLLAKDIPCCQFRTAAVDFTLIKDQQQRSVIVRYGKKSDELIGTIRAIGPNRELMRKLQRYTVNLSVRTTEKMKAEGMLEEVWEGILAQTMPDIYTSKTGLDIFRDSLPAEDLIV